MTDEAKWCSLCRRYVVPKKEFNSIGWVGLVAGVSFLVAALFNESLSSYLTTNALAATLATGVGNIMLNVLLLLVAPLFLISILYCLYYSAKEPRCPICNSQSLTDRTSSGSTDYKRETDLGHGVDTSRSATTPTPLETPRTQSSALQRPSLELQWPTLKLQWLFKDPLISFLSIAAAICVIVGLIFYAFASGLISF